MNTKPHAVTNAKGRPIRVFLSAGQASDYTGAAALLSDLPKSDWLLGDRGYDADWPRYDRCPETFLSAVALAATILFWL